MNQMKRILFIVLIFLMVISLLSGCGKKEPYVYEGVELLENGGMEDFDHDTGLPVDWWKMNSSEDTVDIDYIDTPSYTDNKCLKIQGSTIGKDFCFVAYTINKKIPIGKRLKLTVRIRTQDVIGEGPAMTIRCDDTLYASGDAEQVVGTGALGITGTKDWKTYTLELKEPVKAGMQSITIYLLFLQETSGTIYFDDASLIY